MRVYELAKELDLPSKDLVRLCMDLGIKIKSHMSSIDEASTQKLRDVITGKVKARPVKARQKREAPTVPVLTRPVTIKDMSKELGVKANDLIGHLFRAGMMATINQPLDDETVEVLKEAFSLEFEVREPQDLAEDLVQEFEADEEDLKPRAPVVTFLGHVDHGKTSLLDRIRKTQVAAGESGGITQHIGAYQVSTESGPVTFLDTPGHRAFTEMRARGANVTDVVVLVVAADDGVMPQTEEAVVHAKAAEVPIVVAVNKIDTSGADPQRTRAGLSAIGIQPEEWGGEIAFVDVSAMTGQGIQDLLELLSLEAELLELRANPGRPAVGTVLEAQKTQGRGIVATVLVRDGTLKKGDIALAGQAFGKIRSMYDHRGNEVEEAPPAMPVEVLGLSDAPEAGEQFLVVEDASKARQVASERARKEREADLLKSRTHVTLETLQSHLAEGETKEIKIILKADVKGSLEALSKTLSDLSTDEVSLVILHKGVGGITENDILLADASDAIVIGFHVMADAAARNLAEEKNVDLRTYQVIYEATEELRQALEGLLDPERVEEVIGHLDVKQVFPISKSGNVAGCYCTDGRIRSTSVIRLTRGGKVIYNDGKIASLRRFKEDVKEVRAGLECGVMIDGYNDVKEGDVIEVYEVSSVARTLESDA